MASSCGGSAESATTARESDGDATQEGQAAPTENAPEDSDSSAENPEADGAQTSASEADGVAGETDQEDSASSEAGAPFADVVAVSVSRDEGDYRFAVTIESSDVDCSQFADWWEVLGEDGSLLYRRILMHSHTDDNGTTDADEPGNTFTRDGGPVAIAATDVVLVRAHMNVGGYGGRVMRGGPASEFETATDVDENFATEVELAAPQPTDCLF